MGLILFGMAVGGASAGICAATGQVSPFEAFLIYWGVGTTVPILHMTLYFAGMADPTP